MKGTKETPVIPAEWELYDLKTDPAEMNNIYNNPGNEELIKNLKPELLELKKKYEDEDSEYPQMNEEVEKYYRRIYFKNIALFILYLFWITDLIPNSAISGSLF